MRQMAITLSHPSKIPHIINLFFKSKLASFDMSTFIESRMKRIRNVVPGQGEVGIADTTCEGFIKRSPLLFLK
jgi:hypothetical protein